MDCLAGSSVLPVVSSHHIDQVIVAREPPVYTVKTKAYLEIEEPS